jgi:hypothetical protein
MPIDYFNDTPAEREKLALQVFAFITNENSDPKKVSEIFVELDELKELFPVTDWLQAKPLIISLISEPNAMIYRQNFAEIVGNQVLDLTKDPTEKRECLDLAEGVLKFMKDRNLEGSRTVLETLDEMVSPLVQNDDYSPEIIKAVICSPKNAEYLPKLQALVFGGENDKTI